MSSKLANRKRSAGPYETTALVPERGARPVMVALQPGYVEVWAKGLKSKYTIDYGAIYWAAIRRADLAASRERREARKGKR